MEQTSPRGVVAAGSAVAVATVPAQAESAAAEQDAETAQIGAAQVEAAQIEAAQRGWTWSLSPSRAADFLTCPLLYRFRVIDRLPEAPSPAMARGTLVHAVLERLFDEPAAVRSQETAERLVVPEWERLVAAEPELAALFADEDQHASWLGQAREMIGRYFTLEDPTRLEPANREMLVEAVLESGLRLRGYIDRLDVSAAGEIRIVDYKTGTAPRADFEARALFQMRFYALVLWRTRAVVPRLLQMIYLGNGEIVRYAPDEADLLATERKIEALWRAIERAMKAGDWRPRPGKLCDWCAHQSLCPAFGGTPPPLPDTSAVASSAAAGASQNGDAVREGHAAPDGNAVLDGGAVQASHPLGVASLAREKDFEP
ncbi:MAG TPA: PD-(D/E)XK nuclease family protein [Streptosporangiaceae bacterium]|nr:PD-(D/E)XK nuclease family protein [Streptosporangiaceae bacterium]